MESTKSTIFTYGRPADMRQLDGYRHPLLQGGQWCWRSLAANLVVACWVEWKYTMWL